MHSRRIPGLLAPLVALLLLLAPVQAQAQSQLKPYQTVAGAVQVLAGDLIVVDGVPVRLYGLDAPELGQICENVRGTPYDCGAGARNIMTLLTRDREVECSLYAQRENGMTGRCFADGRDLGLALILRGWAFSYRSLSNRYEKAQARAQANQAGIWSGRAQAPWVWRARQAADGRTAGPRGG